MTTKAYLGQARFLDMRIKSKIQQIDSLRELATSCTAVLSDMPRNPNHGASKVERCVMKIIEVQEGLKDDINELVELKKEIMTTIKAVDDVELQTLLEKRYLCFLSWEKIAVEMHYSIQHIYRMHDSALSAVEEIASPFVQMALSFQKQANLLWYEIFDIVKQNCTTAYEGSPQDDAMEKLLRARSKTR